MNNIPTGIDPVIPIVILLFNFILYVGITWIVFGVLPSISDSFYYWHRRIGFGHIFTIFCFILAIPLVMLADIMPEDFQWIAFLSGAGFGFVGAACLIEDPEVMKVHGAAASIGIVMSLLIVGVGLGGWYWLTVIVSLLIAGALEKWGDNNKIWWIEIDSFLTVIGSLVFHFIL